jgi:hypothetical protein
MRKMPSGCTPERAGSAAKKALLRGIFGSFQKNFRMLRLPCQDIRVAFVEG